MFLVTMFTASAVTQTKTPLGAVVATLATYCTLQRLITFRPRLTDGHTH